MTARWQFVMHQDPYGEVWTWRRLMFDGSIEFTSEPHADFGKAVIDAVRNGFQPKQHPWVVITGDRCTHFAPDEPPVSIPRDTRAVKLQEGIVTSRSRTTATRNAPCAAPGKPRGKSKPPVADDATDGASPQDKSTQRR